MSIDPISYEEHDYATLRPTLTTGTQGDEVKLLHARLQRLGWQIDGDKLNGATDGKSTSRVVAKFHKQHVLNRRRLFRARHLMLMMPLEHTQKRIDEGSALFF